MEPIQTYGLTHLALAVRDKRRSVDFYRTLFGVEVMFENDEMVQVQTPGSNDIIVFQQKENAPFGESGGIAHFGFRLRDQSGVAKVVDRIGIAGGSVLHTGELCEDEPFVFLKDPDGYELEVWFEK